MEEKLKRLKEEAESAGLYTVSEKDCNLFFIH